MRRIKLTVAYDGTNYRGWQVQSNGVTIEEVLNKNLSCITGEDIHVIGASRTDSGVHARGNVAVFDSETLIPPNRAAYALNSRMPPDITVVDSEEVPCAWHPRHCDSVKTYEYHILNSRLADPLRRLYTYHVSYDLDIGKMRRAASFLVGKHDFASFCNIHTSAEDTVRTIYGLTVEKEKDEITIKIWGNGFLYNMVRIIAGTLIQVGRGFYRPEKVKEILEAKDRQAAGDTAPAHGLVLTGIEYR